jgi:ligand-binding sensor protein
MSRTIGVVAGQSVKSRAKNSSVLQREGSAFHDKQLVEALARSKMYRHYERTFTEATGLPLALRPVKFLGLPFHGRKNENAFCEFFASGKASCVFCLQTQTRAGAQPNGQPRSVRCPFGLTETTVPIRLGERVIGFLCTGQVFTQSTSAALFKKSIHRLFPKASTSEKKAFQLWQKTPFISRSKYQATVQLLNFLVMPVTPLEIMSSKIWSMGIVVLITSAISMALVVEAVLGVPINGSRSLFLCGAALHIIAATSLGMFLATFARTMPQFALLMIMVLLPLQMLSGGMTPRESMPEFVQQIMMAAPTTHFVKLAQGILFRGGGLSVVWPQFLALALISAALFGIALIRFRKTIGQMA